MPNRRKKKDFNPNNCGVTHFLNQIGGSWKILILYGISRKCNRFSLLRKAIPQISKQMLVNQMRELQEDQIIERIDYAETPPKVEYILSEYGKSLMPIIGVIEQWGQKELRKKSGL